MAKELHLGHGLDLGEPERQIYVIAGAAGLVLTENLVVGLYHQITQFEVVTVITVPVTTERVDLQPPTSLRPIVVADHGGANAEKHTHANIELQVLKLWLGGIGRPTGNARTERVVGR